MARSDLRLERRIRRAYEVGRLRTGARRVLPFAGAAALAASVSAAPGWTLALAVALAVATLAAVWRGGVLARAARTGLWAGVPPLLVPLLMRALQPGCRACGGMSLELCVAVAATTGAMAGIAVAALALREARRDRPAFVAVALLVAAWAGSLGCVFAGAGGLLGLGAGLLLAAAPALVLARAGAR